MVRHYEKNRRRQGDAMDNELLTLSVEAHDALVEASHKLGGVLLKLESGQHFQLGDGELSALLDFLIHAERLIDECQSSAMKAVALLSPETEDDLP